MNGDGVSKEAFLKATGSLRDELLFDMFKTIYDNQCTQTDICNTRFKKLESAKWIKGAIATVAGGVGGFIAMFTKGS